MTEFQSSARSYVPVLTGHFPYVPLAHLPTPLEELSRLSDALDGPRLFIKRDDQTGLATGGNKTRMLEFLLADALKKRADTLIAFGDGQSNHVRQTVAAAAKVGLRSSCVLAEEQPERWNGNLLLNELLGADIHWAGKRGRSEAIEEEVERVKRMGGRPYVISYDNPRAVIGYVKAMEELMGQLANRDLHLDRVILASGGGGTQAGLIVGAKAVGFTGRIEGVSAVYKKEILKPRLKELITKTAALLELEISFDSEDLVVYDNYLEPYDDALSPLTRESILSLARTEGVIVDPVYTGRAMGGLIDLIRSGVLSDDNSVLFWHTGGIPTLFAYAEEFPR